VKYRSLGQSTDGVIGSFIIKHRLALAKNASSAGTVTTLAQDWTSYQPKTTAWTTTRNINTYSAPTSLLRHSLFLPRVRQVHRACRTTYSIKNINNFRRTLPITSPTTIILCHTHQHLTTSSTLLALLIALGEFILGIADRPSHCRSLPVPVNDIQTTPLISSCLAPLSLPKLKPPNH
jgi:hypothetical protein